MRSGPVPGHGSACSRSHLPLLDVSKALGGASSGFRPFPRRVLQLGQRRTNPIPIVDIRRARLLFKMWKHAYDA